MFTAFLLTNVFIFNRKEAIDVRTDYSQFRPPLSVRTLYRRLLTLFIVYFFLYPRDLNILKFNKLRGLTFMMPTKSINFMTLPPPPSAKINNRSIA